jgi:hypothetical protein
MHLLRLEQRAKIMIFPPRALTCCLWVIAVPIAACEPTTAAALAEDASAESSPTAADASVVGEQEIALLDASPGPTRPNRDAGETQRDTSSPTVAPQHDSEDAGVVAAVRPTLDGAAETLPRADGGVTTGRKRVFVTSVEYSGDLGGLEGADALCARHATAVALDGTYKAWLSTVSVSAASRLTRSNGPYERTDGVVVASNWADLTDGNLAAPINRDEIGAPVEAGVWTGTAIDGASYTEGDCDGFTNPSGGRALCGQSDTGTESWTEDYVPPCSSYLRLYCLQQ